MTNCLRLLLCGDVMTGRGIDQIMPKSVDPILFEPVVQSAKEYVTLAERRHGSIPRNVEPDYIWGDALQLMRAMAPDVSIANLETAVTTSDDRQLKGINYRMHPATWRACRQRTWMSVPWPTTMFWTGGRTGCWKPWTRCVIPRSRPLARESTSKMR